MRIFLGSLSTDHNLKSFLGNTIAEFKAALKQDVSTSARSDVTSDKMAQKTRIRKCLWLTTMTTNKNVKQRVLGMTSMAQKVRSIQLRETWPLKHNHIFHQVPYSKTSSDFFMTASDII